ncbi:hypothetical protein DFH06DRAFT_1129089 [Mycena polygramma]|nr:hypothetical protein DFH06DRAFT_1129089 [Mycena polygramma]
MADHSSDYGPDDNEFMARMASLDLADVETPPSPPRTPSPPAGLLPPIERHTFPSMRSRTFTSDLRTVYHFESPTRRGFTTEWSVAGSATQGVAGAHVRAVQKRRRKKKKNPPPAAYAVFCGLKTGVCLTWEEAAPLVIGVSCSIYRSYSTVEGAHTAYSYAWVRRWVRRSTDPIVSGIPRLPAPTPGPGQDNPLRDDDDEGKWYIVYRGITPGVYASHLESQLNTVGVRGSLHERIDGPLSVALQKFRNGETSMAPAPAYSDVDVFN